MITYGLLFLAIGALAAIITALSKIVGERRCLNTYVIKLFMDNKLSEKDRNTTIAHLGWCKKCQRKLEEYNFGDE